jgi:hypothetical protein
MADGTLVELGTWETGQSQTKGSTLTNIETGQQWDVIDVLPMDDAQYDGRLVCALHAD